jgi:hypothetical protein
MQLFTFLKVSGTAEQMSFYDLGDADGATSAKAALASFDTARAQCYLQRDRQHLLAVIEAGFGDLLPFNQSVRTLFAAVETSNVPKRRRPMRLPPSVSFALRAASGRTSRSIRVVAPEPSTPTTRGTVTRAAPVAAPSAEDLSEIREAERIFRSIDTDRSGTIELAELATYLEKVGEAPSKAHRLVMSLDADGDGKISEAEWRKGWTHHGAHGMLTAAPVRLPSAS